MADDYLLAQGQAKPATEEDLIKDASGITHPNLHRRIDLELSPIYADLSLQTAEGDNLLTPEGDPILVSVDVGAGTGTIEEVILTTENDIPITLENGEELTMTTYITKEPEYEYVLMVQGVNSFRNTKYINTDEDSEIP